MANHTGEVCVLSRTWYCVHMLNFKTAVTPASAHIYHGAREREPSKSNVGDTRCLECLRGHVQPAIPIIQPAVLILPAVIVAVLLQLLAHLMVVHGVDHSNKHCIYSCWWGDWLHYQYSLHCKIGMLLFMWYSKSQWGLPKSQGDQLDGHNGHSSRWSHDKQFHSANFILGNTHLCGGLVFILSRLPLLWHPSLIVW